MRISKVASQDFKGQTFQDTLGPCTLYVGRNGSGKSSRLQAIQYAVTGATKAGKKVDSAAPFAGPIGFSVGVEIEDGPSFSRSLIRDTRTGSFTQVIDVHGRNKLNTKEADAFIAEACGRFMPMWDLSEFTSLSPDKKRDFVLNICTAALTNTGNNDLLDDVRLETMRVLVGDGAVDTAIQAEDVSLLGRHLSEIQKESLDKIMSRISSEIVGDPTQALASAIESAKSIVNSSKASAERANEAAQRLSQRKAEIKVTAGTAAQLEDEVRVLLKDRDEVLAQISHQAGRMSARKSIEQELSRVREQIERMKAAGESDAVSTLAHNNDMATVLRLEQAVADLDAEIKAMVAPDSESLRQQYLKSHGALVAERTRAETLKRESNNLDARCHTINTQIVAIAECPWQRVRDLLILVESEMDGRGIDLMAVEDFRNAIEIVKQNCDDKLIEQKRADYVATAAERDAYAQQYLDLCESIKAMESAHAELEKEMQTALNEHDAFYNMQQAKIHERNNLEREATNLRNALKSREIEIVRRADAMVELDNRRIEAEKRLNDLASDGGLIPEDILNNRLNGINEQIRAANDELSVKAQYHVLESELTRAISAAESERVTHLIAKAVVEAIKNIRERIMKDSVRPLLKTVNQFLDACDVRRSAYCRLENARGTACFELGWSDGTREVSIDALSGGESCIFGAALAYALTILANPPIKVLMIEAAEIDSVNMCRLLHGLLSVSINLDNVIVATSAAFPIPGNEHWTVKSLAGSVPVLDGV